jgi:hypothetical protein
VRANSLAKDEGSEVEVGKRVSWRSGQFGSPRAMAKEEARRPVAENPEEVKGPVPWDPYSK